MYSAIPRHSNPCVVVTGGRVWKMDYVEATLRAKLNSQTSTRKEAAQMRHGERANVFKNAKVSASVLFIIGSQNSYD